ncbi:hypothetical protein QE152_g32389 [Popillia japonica]|uniref:Uncharacterized protein n=1 Tax=Popillia japonica TaxID=7064 RepID=A0AAW1IZ83_POPJA
MGQSASRFEVEIEYLSVPCIERSFYPAHSLKKALSSYDQPATNRSRFCVAPTIQGSFWYAGDVIPNQQGLFVTKQKGLVVSHKTSPGSSRERMSSILCTL